MPLFLQSFQIGIAETNAGVTHGNPVAPPEQQHTGAALFEPGAALTEHGYGAREHTARPSPRSSLLPAGTEARWAGRRSPGSVSAIPPRAGAGGPSGRVAAVRGRGGAGMAGARGGWRGPARALTMAAAAAPATGREKERRHPAANHKAVWGPSPRGGALRGAALFRAGLRRKQRQARLCVPDGSWAGFSSVSYWGKAQLRERRAAISAEPSRAVCRRCRGVGSAVRPASPAAGDPGLLWGQAKPRTERGGAALAEELLRAQGVGPPQRREDVTVTGSLSRP